MIRIAKEKDLDAILEIQRQAFQQEDEAELVTNLLKDQTAQPCLSLLAEEDGNAIGHILFTKVRIKGSDISAYLLAPLAIHPDYHYKGWGQRLMDEGFRQLTQKRIELVFVLGDPAYYSRMGFERDAGDQGYPAPHAIPEKWKDAWMVMRLIDESDDTGDVIVADAIAAEEYWSA